MSSLLSRRAPLASTSEQLKALEGLPVAREFHEALKESSLTPFRPTRIEIFQLNVGKLCNQTCKHCHVDAGPDRREQMSRATMELCLQALAKTDIPTVDITGGAPELNPHFEWLVTEVRKLGRHVMDRCNLTILETPSHAHLPKFFADNQVEVVCSLPHFRATNTDAQRGEGVFEKSISALKKLNAVGYGTGNGLRLVLVTNPVGAFLPAAQASLEKEWKRELDRLHGIKFDALFCLTNMPISRYLEWLMETSNLEGYMERLVNGYNPAAAANVMCRNTISVSWDGKLYDCDFNQMLDMEVDAKAPRHIKDFDKAALEARTIVTHRHCFGCTAGAGSSCGGSTA
ncbi:MAG TPA: arsenosugar biosynthesis radical SAM (seleno)protein ArsS [Myxococcota bacterium]|nr:arsenosugar biosynthesis radical SAM (seleno)protein ArsS [Myxococcota bacterium]